MGRSSIHSNGCKLLPLREERYVSHRRIVFAQTYLIWFWFFALIALYGLELHREASEFSTVRRKALYDKCQTFFDSNELAHNLAIDKQIIPLFAMNAAKFAFRYIITATNQWINQNVLTFITKISPILKCWQTNVYSGETAKSLNFFSIVHVWVCTSSLWKRWFVHIFIANFL